MPGSRRPMLAWFRCAAAPAAAALVALALVCLPAPGEDADPLNAKPEGDGFVYPEWGDDQPVDAPQPDDARKDADQPQFPAWNGEDQALTDKAVRAAIDRAIVYLKSVQQDDGLFVGMYGRSYPLGETALALLAMRYGGIGITDPAYQKGEKALLEGASQQTYVSSLMAQVLAMVPKDKHTPPLRQKMTQLAVLLNRLQCPNGMWTYQPFNAARAGANALYTGDNSNTQFAVLGLWQLSEAGIEFDLRNLQRCEKHFLETQLADGGWSYMRPVEVNTGTRRIITSSGSRPSMTATGLATLHIFEDLMHLRDGGPCTNRRAPRAGWNPHMAERIDAATAKAEKDLEAWFARFDRTARQAGSSRQPVQTGSRSLSMYDLYYLYSVERVGAASGQKTFGAIDWYASGARLLLADQNDDGSWGRQVTLGRGRPNEQPQQMPTIVETSLAVLFLAKGRAPVLYNKLRYAGDWNIDRRDVANLVRYTEKALEQHFNWQVVDINGEVDSWLDAPVLYLSGYREPALTAAQRKKLAEYVGRGGFLFAAACYTPNEFTDAVKDLGKELWPGCQWEKLADDHPLYTRASHFDLKTRPVLWGLTDKNGFTFFILAPFDVSCLWHQNLLLTHEETFKFAINVFRYASRGKPIRARLAD